MAHRLLQQDAHTDFWQVVFVDGLAPDVVHVGLPLAPADMPDGPVRLTIAPFGREPSDFLALPVPAVSDAMRRALDAAGVDTVQYLPAHVDVQYAEADGPVATDYWVLNILGAVACTRPIGADDGAGAPSEGPAQPFRIDPVRTCDLDLFRLAEDRRLLVVSPRVAARLQAAGLRGLVLQDPAEYDGRPVVGGALVGRAADPTASTPVPRDA